MNLAKLLEMQRVLDERIIKDKGLEGQDLLPNTILALQVELGELANEWRGFKHWSNRKTPKMYPQETCDYCGEEADYTRPTPFMADAGASMCKACWDSTKVEYAASNDEYIPDFEEYPHFPPKHPTKLLEEYVDCLHFILSIGLQTGMHFLEEVKEKEATGGLIQQFLSLNKHVSRFQFAYEVDQAGGFETANFSDAYQFAFRLFVGLGNMLGFTWEQIEQAYIDKNKVNHDRQASGY